MTLKQVAQKTGVNIHTVRMQAKKFNIGTLRPHGRRWHRDYSKADVERLREINTRPEGMSGTEEVAAELGISTGYLRELAGELGLALYGRRRLYSAADIEAIRARRRENQNRAAEESAQRIKRDKPRQYQTAEEQRESGRRLHAAWQDKFVRHQLRVAYWERLDFFYFDIAPTACADPELSSRMAGGPIMATLQWHRRGWPIEGDEDGL